MTISLSSLRQRNEHPHVAKEKKADVKLAIGGIKACMCSWQGSKEEQRATDFTSNHGARIQTQVRALVLAIPQGATYANLLS